LVNNKSSAKIAYWLMPCLGNAALFFTLWSVMHSDLGQTEALLRIQKDLPVPLWAALSVMASLALANTVIAFVPMVSGFLKPQEERAAYRDYAARSALTASLISKIGFWAAVVPIIIENQEYFAQQLSILGSLQVWIFVLLLCFAFPPMGAIFLYFMSMMALHGIIAFGIACTVFFPGALFAASGLFQLAWSKRVKWYWALLSLPFVWMPGPDLFMAFFLRRGARKDPPAPMGKQILFCAGLAALILIVLGSLLVSINVGEPGVK